MLKVQIIKDDNFLFLFAFSLSTYPLQPDNCQDSRMKSFNEESFEEWENIRYFSLCFNFPLSFQPTVPTQ
jgi:hypothetical protein